MKEVTAQDAHDLINSDQDYRYLDVRTVQEFEDGHPPGALNVPVMNFVPGTGMVPNDDFLAVVEANLPRDSKLVVGCMSGGRSARACEMMSQIGYTNIANVRGGYGGLKDALGQIVEPGWTTLGLPTSKSSGDERSYEKLAARAGKSRA